MPNKTKTIFATSSGNGVAAISVVRISGPEAINAIQQFFKTKTLLEPRKAVLKSLWWKQKRLDQAIVIYFEKTKSFTGEKTVEVHLHGSIAIVGMFIDALGSLEDLRQAGPGDFTRQAFDNGRMKIPEVEGLANLINAETESQKIQAERLFYGEFSEIVSRWRINLLNIKAKIESLIDFPEDDVEVDLDIEVSKKIEELIDNISAQLSGSVFAEKLNNGFSVAIVGGPNVGKSTLLNYLVGENVSIVSEIAGTTRDIIEKRVKLGSFLVSFFDCAGLRETDDQVERIGVEKAKEIAKKSDLRIFLVEDPLSADFDFIEKRPGDEIRVCKSDVNEKYDGFIGISGKTGEGVKELVDVIMKNCREYSEKSGVACNVRHRNAMEKAINYLYKSKSSINDDCGLELIVENIRQALLCLEELIGKIDIEDVYGEIFTKFCIGK